MPTDARQEKNDKPMSEVQYRQPLQDAKNKLRSEVLTYLSADALRRAEQETARTGLNHPSNEQ